MQLRRNGAFRVLWKIGLLCAAVTSVYAVAQMKMSSQNRQARESDKPGASVEYVFEKENGAKKSTKSDKRDVEVAKADKKSDKINDNSKETLVSKVKDALEYPNEKYHIIPNLISPVESNLVPKENDIVICTQTSLGNLHRIENLAKNWGGEVSVAVFSFDEEVSLALEYIMLLHKCSTIVQRKTRFHLVYPMSHPPTDLKSFYKKTFKCSNLQQIQSSFDVENYDLNNIPYPVNLLRNVAFMYSSSPYVFNLDIDFSPAKKLREEMSAFLQKRPASEKAKKTAFLIPCFESNTTTEIKNKKDLVEEVKRGTIRQFTYFKCYRCHINTNYSRWLSLPYPSEMAIGYYIDFLMPHEPYYIADRKRMPMFDARFKQYGINRVSQICEAYYSGYDFGVMNNAFVIHDGFKTPEGFYEWKKNQNRFNRSIFDTIFKGDLKLRYPNSTRDCIYMDSNPQPPELVTQKPKSK